MVNKQTYALAVTHAFLLVSCQSKAPAPSVTSPGSAPATSKPACEPMAELAELDPRKPVPLQPMMAWHQKQNMMGHLVAIQRITDALAREDWAGVALEVVPIQTSPAMKQMCQHMGAGAEGFTEMALEFHRRADTIADAARAKDGAAVLFALGNTLQACTGCHETYRQELVDSKTWEQRTGQAHVPAMMHGEPDPSPATP